MVSYFQLIIQILTVLSLERLLFLRNCPQKLIFMLTLDREIKLTGEQFCPTKCEGKFQDHLHKETAELVKAALIDTSLSRCMFSP